MNLYTGDMHFGHSNIIHFDHRPFKDRDEMDHVLIELWNGRVQPDDTVYILGDICYHSDHSPEWYLRQLKGHKILILGNHDLHILDNPKALHYLEAVERMMYIQDEDKSICLCHFPIAEWNGYFHGTWHIYGHIHNSKNEAYEFMKTKERALNAGCMINNYTPASFNELVRNNEALRVRGKMDKVDKIEAKKAGRAILYRNPEGNVEELLAYIEHLEEQRDKAWAEVREWNKDSEIQHAKEKEKAAYLKLSKGFAPDDDQWEKINEWEKKHTEKYHKEPDVGYLTKKRLNGLNYSYRFEYSPIGTLGAVVCTVCERKALKRCLGNETMYEELMKKYDAHFMFGEV